MKTHINFGVTDLQKSFDFYSVFLETAAAKHLPDYALFISENPGLELALDRRETVRAGSDAHYGICVESVQDVEAAIERLEKHGLAAAIEREVRCCYAKQSKVWAVDPDGRRWEVYTVHEDTEDARDGDTACCAA